MSRVLFIDPESPAGGTLSEDCLAVGRSLVHASTLSEGLEAIAAGDVDLIITRLALPDGDGLDLLTGADRNRLEIPVIVLADGPELEGAAEALRRGAVACMIKPLRPEALRIAIAGAVAGSPRKSSSESNDAPPVVSPQASAIVGESDALRHALDVVRAVARTSQTVLIQGESGTGKELLAHVLHEESGRAGRPFIAVNCAAMPEGLIESTLFGHERGAFTGAMARFIGAFERADGGSLLLDEISELRLDLQAKLLRAIQEKQFERVGGSRPVSLDVRIIATTNQDLQVAVAEGRFRRDLYYRLQVIPIRVPPLRERPEDIPLLVRHFIEETSRDLGISPPQVPPQILDDLRGCSWPGNIRELQSAVIRAILLKRRGPFELEDFVQSADLSYDTEGRLGETSDAEMSGQLWETLNLRTLERLAIEHALLQTGGNRTRAAMLLGISDRTLRSKLNGPRNAPGPTFAVRRKVVPLNAATSSALAGLPEPFGASISAA